MLDAIARLSSSWPSLGESLAWAESVLWPMIAGEVLMALAFLSLPLLLVVLARRRGDLRFNWIMWLLSAFMLLSGLTHLLAVWLVWEPVYWLLAGVKLLTGIVSVAAAVLLWPMIPKALRIPSVNQLQAAIARLETEAVERRRAEARLAQVNAELEARIHERTLELEREVAERQRLQDADRAREAAELASSAKSEFLSRMSHELRTPLNAVLGFAQLSARSLSDGDIERTLTYLRHIEDGGWHLVKMIDDILDISRIEQGRQSFTLSAVDLGPAVAEAAAMVQPLAGQQQVSLGIELPELPPPVYADRTRLIQVLTNLLSNATKFNRPGGEVHVRLGAGDDEHVRIEVQDTGLGMSPAQQAQLFQPFNRLGRERLGIPGTGIGLVLVRHLVEQMGGRIEVTSTEGAGTTFAVVLRRNAQPGDGLATLPDPSADAARTGPATASPHHVR
ncbi:MAG: ATP-binding protein [Pseudomonadota bacterium]